MERHVLPPKIGGYLRRLALSYERRGPKRLHDVVASCRYWVREESGYDNWNGGTWTHDVVIFVPPSILANIDLEDQENISTKIRDELNQCGKSFQNESVGDVILDQEDENDPEFIKSAPLNAATIAEPEALSIWKPGCVRLFVSHRDGQKHEANILAESLLAFGISSFVAHDTIEPLATWQTEIMKGLRSMEVMLAFITEDFADSPWTNQELGYALGRGIPVISLKLGRKDPPGFLSSTQALKGRVDKLEASAPDIYHLLAKKLGHKHRLQEACIAAFVSSSSFPSAISSFDRMVELVAELDEDDVDRLKLAYQANDQIRNCAYLFNNSNRFLRFMHDKAGKDFEIYQNKLRRVPPADLDDEIPF